MMTDPIYFDNAATTFPKPPEVVRAVTATMRRSCGNPGRGSHRLARAAADILYDCREEISSFLGSKDPTRVIFTHNTTHALNIAIQGFFQKNDHVIISDLEHNSVLRPLAALEKEKKITYDVFSSAAVQNENDVEQELEKHLKYNTRGVICTHASNVCSRTLPLEAIGRFCRRHGLCFIVDAAQSLGHLPINVNEMGITALCAPGHKGAYGPQGSGFLLLSDSLSEKELPSPLLYGGSGFQSLLTEMPALPPERYEAGTAATPMVAGLTEGIRFVRRIGIDRIREREDELFTLARDMLLSLRDVKVYAPEAVGSVLSFSVNGRHSEEIAELLDEEGICVRAGFHCSSLAHATLNTPKDSGSIRLGFGYFNTPPQIYRFIQVMEKILK